MLSAWPLAFGSLLAVGALGACGAFGDAASDAPPTEAGAPEDATQGDASVGTDAADAGPPASGLEVVHSGLSNPRGIVATPKWVYWADGDTGIIWRVSTGADRKVFQWKSTGAAPFAIVAHGETVHWSEYGQGNIKSALEDGTPTSPTVSAMSSGARAMATTSTRLVYVNDNTAYSVLFTDGPIASTLTPLMEPAELDTNDTQTWWTESGAARVWSSSPDLSNPVAIEGEIDARGILATSTGAIWTKRDGTVREKTNGGTATRATGFFDPRSIQQDARGLYVLTANGFFRVPAGGGKEEFLGPSTYRTDLVLAMKGIALTPNHVYWIDNGAGTIYRLPR